MSLPEDDYSGMPIAAAALQREAIEAEKVVESERQASWQADDEEEDRRGMAAWEVRVNFEAFDDIWNPKWWGDGE